MLLSVKLPKGFLVYCAYGFCDVFIFEAFPVILKMWFGTDSYTKALGIQTKQYEIENQNVTEVSLLNAQADHETNLNTAKERMLDVLDHWNLKPDAKSMQLFMKFGCKT